jgi:hypothetical protein
MVQSRPAGLLILSLSFPMGAAGAAQPAATQADIRALVQKWNGPDRSAAREAGRALSDAFLSNPDALLNVMSHDSKSWFSWLDALPQHSFTVSRSEDLPERELLLEKMRAAVRSYPSGKSLVTLARQLEERLKRVQVRVGDARGSR